MTRANLLKILDLSSFIAIDFETTGLSKYADRIIEVAAILFEDGKPVDRFVTLVNPETQISDEIIKITGITNEMVCNSPTEKEIVQNLKDFISNYPLVAHNTQFDEGFMNELFVRHNKSKLNNILYDTLHLARVVQFDKPAYNLGYLAELHNLSSEGSHRAEKDTENCGQIFLQLIEEASTYPLEIISKCVSILREKKYYNKTLFINLANYLVKQKDLDNGLIKSEIERKLKQNFFKQTSNKNYSFPEVDEVFGDKGTLALTISKFEKRNDQIQFIEFIDDVLSKPNSIGLIEAGTGLGKSFGYLYEAMKYIHKSEHENPIVISCYTKNLQDQLFYKDLPAMAKTLKNTISSIKLKGRSNYICLSRLNWLIGDASGMLSDEESAHLLPLIFWLHNTKTGDLDECTGFINSRHFRLKKLIQSEPGFCTTHVCAEHNGCFLGKIRKNLFETDIIVINHALLLNDIINPGILPPFDTLIIDEGHNIIDAAYSQFRQSLDEPSLISSLLVCQPKYSGNKRWYNKLKAFFLKIEGLKPIVNDLDDRIDQAMEITKIFFSQLSSEYGNRYSQDSPYIEKITINDLWEEYRNLPEEISEVKNSFKKCQISLKRLYDIIEKWNLDKEVIAELLLSTKQKLDIITESMDVFNSLTESQSEAYVYWQEGAFRSQYKKNDAKLEVSIHSSPIDTGIVLSKYLFPKIDSIILTSATLKVDESFEYFLNRSGIGKLKDKNIQYATCSSPFFYSDQVSYHQYSGDKSLSENPMAIAEVIFKCYKKLNQKILVLFTAYSSLSKVTHCLSTLRGGKELPVFSQTQRSSRYALIEGMAQSKNGILMGTSSFWEGIDLSGEMLEILIITKLPFQVPSDPIVKAYSESLAQNNVNSFLEFTVPECILKYRQGFGRLIRTSYDQGIFINLDNRIVTKRYGKQFQDAIPVNMKMFSTLDSLIL